MKYLKFFLIQAASIGLLLFLAALPLHLYNLDGMVISQPFEIPHEIKNFLAGLLNGEAYFYMQGYRKRFLLSDLASFFFSSYFYLTISLLIVIILSLIFGIWFWKKSAKWVASILGFIGIIPDFILVLLLQLLVTYIYKQTGVKVVKVASLTMDDPAIFLPIFTLSILPLFYLIRTLNDKTYEVLTEDYILTAKAKGLTKRYIYLNHVTSNVLPFLKADLYKIVGMSLSNLFIIEYLYNTRGLTDVLFEYPKNFGYQYNLVVITLLSFFLLYIGTLFTIKFFIFLIERIFING